MMSNIFPLHKHCPSATVALLNTDGDDCVVFIEAAISKVPIRKDILLISSV